MYCYILHLDNRGVSEVTVIRQHVSPSYPWVVIATAACFRRPRAFTRPQDFLFYTSSTIKAPYTCKNHDTPDYPTHSMLLFLPPTCLLQADVVIGKLHNVRDDALIVFNENLVRLPNPNAECGGFAPCHTYCRSDNTMLIYHVYVYIICIIFSMQHIQYKYDSNMICTSRSRMEDHLTSTNSLVMSKKVKLGLNMFKHSLTALVILVNGPCGMAQNLVSWCTRAP